MKHGVLRYPAIIFFCLFAILFQTTRAAAIDKIVVFGDSLSDNGNIFSLTSFAHNEIPLIPIIPKDPPYYQGRFSNGPVWVDNLAEAMNVPQVNYAYGGSWAEPLKDSKLHVPFGLGMQVNFYLVASVLDFHKSEHLYIIWSGANDYIGGRSDPEYATTNTVATIQENIEWLIYYGAKNILVLNVPDLGTVPEVTMQGPEAAAAATRLSALHNQKFADMIAKEKEANPDVRIVLGDVGYYFNDIIANPARYQLKNVTQPCYDGGYWLRSNRLSANSPEMLAAKKINLDVMRSPSLKTAYVTSELKSSGQLSCSNPDEYLFWDEVHPTRVMHSMLATKVFDLLSENEITGQTAYKNKIRNPHGSAITK
jgi:phospholipase/lecithinase/hemolysin